MVVAQKAKEAEITEQDSLLLTRNLLRIAIFNISYIRGLFPEKYFSDKNVPALEMKIKKLMPMDLESRRLIDWMEKGVYDALQKKYLKRLLFCVCESIEGPMMEEYAFAFSYSNSDSQEVSMHINRTGTKKEGGTFTYNSTTEITPNQMRSSACKMIRTLVQLMRTLDKMPEERTLLMKLHYYDDVTPADYEPPFFRCCSEEESHSAWTKSPLKMEVGNVNSKHFVLALKVKSVLDPCEDENDDTLEDEVSFGADSLQKDDYSESDSEVSQSQENNYIIAPAGMHRAEDYNSNHDEDDTQDAEETKINLKSFDNGINEVKEEISGKEIQIDNKAPKIEDRLYMKALYYALPMKYVTVAKLQSFLEGEANHSTVRKLMDKMIQDGYLEAKGIQRLGKRVIRSNETEKKLMEVRKIMDNEAMDIDNTNEFQKGNGLKDNSTCGVLHSIGSDLTRMRIKSDTDHNSSVKSEPIISKRKNTANTPTSKAEPVESRESFFPANHCDEAEAVISSRSSQDKRPRKTSAVKEPIVQFMKRLRAEAV